MDTPSPLLPRPPLVDELTGLLDGAAMLERLRAEASRARALRRPLAILLLDVERLRETNERFGREEGDRQLRHAAEAVRRSIRHGRDAAFRRGGSELALILPGASPEQAGSVSRRIQLAALSSPAVSFCVGVASLGDAEDPDRALARAQADLRRTQRRRREPRPLPGLERLLAAHASAAAPAVS